jgi:tetratricopeptide (TPR) repeat protein
LKNIEKDYVEMKKYFLMAIELKNSNAMYNLGSYYDEIEKDYVLMKKYYQMAIELNDSNAMVNLGLYYEDVEKDYVQMKKYFQMAIDLNNSRAMYNLGFYYDEIEKDYVEMKKYYQMAIELNDANTMNNLGWYYYEIEKDYILMKKYFLMAIDLNNSIAMNNLGCYYEEINDIKNMMKYYLMAINAGAHYERLYSIFIKGPKLINFEKMNEIINIINNKQIDINKYKLIILQIISKFSLKEQYNIRISLNMKTKQDIEIELKLKNFSKELATFRRLYPKKRRDAFHVSMCPMGNLLIGKRRQLLSKRLHALRFKSRHGAILLCFYQPFAVFSTTLKGST